MNVNLKKNALLIILLLLVSGFTASILLINPVNAATSTHTYDWIDIWGESETNLDDADDIAINSTGSIIVGGTTQAQHQYLAIYDNNTGTRLWNDTILSGTNKMFAKLDVSGNDIYATASDQGSDEVFTYKYNDTKMQEWNVTWQSSPATYSCYPRDVEFDGGNAYIVGSTNIDSSGFLIKYDDAGVKQWNVTVGPRGPTQALGLAVNGTSIYVVGRTGNIADAFLAKHSITDGSQEWNVTQDYSDGAYDWANDVIVNGSDIYITGEIVGSLNDAFLARYNSTGHQVWNVSYTPRQSSGTTLAIDSENDSIYVAGYIADDMYYDYHKALLLKYDTDGNFIRVDTWEREFDQGADAHSVAVDSAGNVYLVGRANNSNGFYDAFIIKNLVETISSGGGTTPPIPGFEIALILGILSLVILFSATKKKKLDF